MLEELQLEISSQAEFKNGQIVERKSDNGSSSPSVPIVSKSPTKIVNASVSLVEKSQQETSEILSTSETDAKVLKDLGFSKSRPEPVSIFSQKTTSFQGEPLSSFYAAVYQAFIEDSFSLAYAQRIFEKALEIDPKFFEEKESQILQNIDTVAANLETISLLLLKIRDFDDSLRSSSGKELISQTSTNNIEKVGPLSDLTSPKVVTDPVSFLSEFFSHSNAKERVLKKSSTAVLTSCLSVLEDYLSRCITNAVFPNSKTTSKSLSDTPFEVSRPVSQDAPDIKSLSSDLSTKGSLFENDNTSMVYQKANLGFYGDREIFQKIAYEPQIKKAQILSTMFANELLLSAGLGRLSQTPAGNRFGSDSSLFPKTFVGISDTGRVDQETSYENSLCDFLLVDQDGSPRAENNTSGKKVLLFDDSSFDPSEDYTLTTSTNEFAKTAIRTPTKNKLSTFENALQSCQKAAEESLEFYKVLASRDKNIETITPVNTFARCLEVVKNAIEEAAGDVDFAEKSRLAELALFATYGDSKVTNNRISRPMAGRSILFTICSKIAFKKLQARGQSASLTYNRPPTGEKKKTKISVENKGTGQKDTFVVETTDVSDKSVETLSLDESAIRMASDELAIFDDDPTNAGGNFLIYGMASQGSQRTFPTNTDTFDINLSSVLESIADDPKSIVSQIVDLFLDSVDEARKISQSERPDSNFINANRLTRLSSLDGGTLLALIFESVVELCSAFATTRVLQVPPMSSTRLSFQRAMAGDIIESIRANQDFKFKKVPIRGQFGPGSRHDLTSRALSLIIEGVKNGSFENAYNEEGLIPNLDLAQPGVDIQANFSGRPKISFLTMTEMMEDSSSDRDLPYASLLSFAGKLDYIRQQTQDLSEIGKRLSGDLESDDQSEKLSNFAKTALGKKYFQSMTDASIATSYRRLAQIQEGASNSVRRRPRIKKGELAAIKALSSKLASTESETVNICFLGLPAEFLESSVYPAFNLENGFNSPVSESSMRLRVRRQDSLSEIESEPVDFLFSASKLIGVNSFDLFENEPPSSLEEVVEKVVLLNGQTGSQFISSTINAQARSLLENEVKSYLLKRAISLLSPNDFFSENIVRGDSHKRDPGSEFLAEKIGQLAGHAEGTFSKVFTKKLDAGVTIIVPDQMLALTSTTTTKALSSQTSEFSRLNFGEAEMLYDIFSSILFKSTLVDDVVFGETVFDRVVAFHFSESDFFDIVDHDYKKIVSGKAVQANDPYAAGLEKSDPGSGVFTMKNYEVVVSAGSPMVKK